MSDPATQPTEAVPTSATAAATTEPAPSAAQTTTPVPDPGSITEADFSHPEYGAKVKNAYTGMQKAQQEAAELRKKQADFEGKLKGVESTVLGNPELAASWAKYLKSKGLPVPDALVKAAGSTDAPQGDNDDDSRPLTRAELKALKEEWKAELGSRDALQSFMQHVGGGDLSKGSTIYHENQKDLLSVMQEMSTAPLDRQLVIANEILTARRAASRPPAPTTPAPSAASDMGRASGSVPVGEPVEGVPTVGQWLKQAGFSSMEEFMRAQRA